VTGENGQSGAVRVQVERVSPGLFSADARGRGVAAAYVLRVREDGSRSYQPAYQCSSLGCSMLPIDRYPTSDRIFLEVYGTGIRGARGLSAVKAEINGLPVEVAYAGAHPLMEGLDQVILRIPNSIGVRGYVTLRLGVEGKLSNAVSVRLR